MLAFFLAVLETETERQQFTALYEQYHDRMEQIALNILGEQHDAEDAVQNSFLQIIRHFEKISEISCEELPFWIISIVRLFRNLPETYRAVLEMKILIGYTDKEIAKHLGISETAVSSRASRGRELLRKLIEKEGLHT